MLSTRTPMIGVSVWGIIQPTSCVWGFGSGLLRDGAAPFSCAYPVRQFADLLSTCFVLLLLLTYAEHALIPGFRDFEQSGREADGSPFFGAVLLSYELDQSDQGIA